MASGARANNWYQSVQVARRPPKISGPTTTETVNITDGKDDGGGTLVIQRVVRDTGGSWPLLTRTNYADWALLMQVMPEAHQLWFAVSDRMLERETDRTAMECMLQSILPEMLSTLASKAMTKDAWKTVKTMRLGVSRVREAEAATLSREYTALRFSGMASKLSLLGEHIPEKKVVQKFLSFCLENSRRSSCPLRRWWI